MSSAEVETVARFLKSLKENPTLVAACLVYGEKMQLAYGFWIFRHHKYFDKNENFIFLKK